jgi:hypothetical protein
MWRGNGSKRLLSIAATPEVLWKYRHLYDIWQNRKQTVAGKKHETVRHLEIFWLLEE